MMVRAKRQTLEEVLANPDPNDTPAERAYGIIYLALKEAGIQDDNLMTEIRGTLIETLEG